MAIGRETFLAYAYRWRARPEADASADAALLDRFVADRDEAAFAALVARHGPLVLHVCRRVLGDSPDADDAFQAAFLVLARRANIVSPREAVAAWLHGVAHRVASKAGSARARRFQTHPLPETPPADPRPDPLAELSASELLAIVDAEVRQLPAAYRLPVILCCLEGRSLEETARQLGWSSGSVKGRLERGRARLHGRLARRGVTLSAALATAEVSRGAASAALAARLAAAATRFAADWANPAGLSAEAAAWATDVVKGMAVARLKVAATLLLTTCLLAAGLLAYRVPGEPA